MPMPTVNTPWPPIAWAPAYKQYADNDAWLTGDTTALAAIYASANSESTHARAGRPHSGGMVSAASHLFWGRTAPAGEHRSRAHVPTADDLATLASDLQYSDPPVSPSLKNGPTYKLHNVLIYS